MLGMLKTLFAPILGVITFIPALLKALIFRRLRINNQQAQTLINLLKEKGKSFVIYSEEGDNKMPAVYEAWCILDKILFKVLVTERLNKAGYDSISVIAEVSMLRSQMK